MSTTLKERPITSRLPRTVSASADCWRENKRFRTASNAASVSNVAFAQSGWQELQIVIHEQELTYTQTVRIFGMFSSLHLLRTNNVLKGVAVNEVSLVFPLHPTSKASSIASIHRL